MSYFLIRRCLTLLVLIMLSHSQLAADNDVQSFLDVDTDIKLGVVPCNSKIQVRRVVRNISDEPLVLTFKSSDCGCLSSEKKVCIEPKQEQTLHVNLDMHFVPQQISKRLVYEVQVSNVVMPLVFTCTANVQAILIKQREIPLGNLKPQEKSVLTIPRYKEDTWELMHAEIDGVRKEKILVDPNGGCPSYSWRLIGHSCP